MKFSFQFGDFFFCNRASNFKQTHNIGLFLFYILSIKKMCMTDDAIPFVIFCMFRQQQIDHKMLNILKIFYWCCFFLLLRHLLYCCPFNPLSNPRNKPSFPSFRAGYNRVFPFIWIWSRKNRTKIQPWMFGKNSFGYNSINKTYYYFQQNRKQIGLLWFMLMTFDHKKNYLQAKL